MKYIVIFIIFSLISPIANAQVFAESQKIVASDRQELGRFGQSVAISGNYAVVGAYGMGAFNNGQVYVFEKQGGSWVQIQILQNADNENYDRFGYAVDIDGDYIVVGAYGEDDDELGNNNLSKAGSAYIYKNIAGMWTQTQKIIANDRTASDEFGWSVAIDGNTIVVGAHLEEEDENGLNSIYHAGSVYIFDLNTGTGIWSQTQKIVASDRAADINYPTGGYSGEDVADLFGHAVAISKDYLIVGAMNHDWDETNVTSNWNGGAAYIFERTGGVWTEVKKIRNSDNAEWDRFGASVSIDSNYVVVGTYSHDYSLTGTNYMPNSGAVYVYDRDLSGSWSEQQKLVAPTRNTGDRFGWSVAMDSLFLVVGVKEDNDNKNETNALVDAGSAHIFKRNSVSGSYSQLQKIDASDRDSLDLFGNAVGIDGTNIIVGAFEQDYNELQLDSLGNAGAAYIYAEIACPPVSVNQNITICNGQTFTIASNTYNTTGIYEDTLTSINGCDSIVTTDLTVNNGFEITQNIIICYGESYTIGNSVYTTPGNYSDTLQMVTGTCDSIVYTNLTVNLPLDLSIDVNGNALESNQNNSYYQWVDCANNYQNIVNTTANQQQIDVVETGNYAVIINNNGCVDTSACVFVNYLSNNTNFGLLSGAEIYPNPATETLNIKLQNTTNVKIQILDISGQLVYQTNANQNSTSIDVSELKNGIYIVKIISESVVITKQFVKQ